MKRPAHGTRPIAGTIGLAFGGLWSFVGAESLPGPLRGPATAAGVLVTGVLVARLWWKARPAEAGALRFRRRAYLMAVALEVAGIYAASVLLPRLGLQSFLIPAVGAIVGLHFVGLWRASKARRFLWTAGAMCAVAAVAALLPDAWTTGFGRFGMRDAVAGYGEALVLWGLAGAAMRSVPPA